MKVLQVGCGSISRLWLNAIKDNRALDLVGLVDLDLSVAEAAAADRGFDVPCYSDLSAALSERQPDVVFDCSVPEAHHDVTIAALKAGCHVMGEKPLAPTMAQARAMIETALAAERTYAVMQNRRFDPSIRLVREFLQSGAIGDITTVNADFFLGPHFGGFREHMAHVLIIDMAIHTFDAARLLTGQNPLSVYCHEWNPRGSWYDRDASAIAIFDMTGGVVFTYQGSWCADGLQTSWEGRWHIVGTKGSLIWDGDTGLRCEIAGERDGALLSCQHDVPVPTLIKTPSAGWHAAAIDSVARDLAAGRIPETVCTDNVYSLAMALGAARSADLGRRIDLTEAWDAT